MYNCINRQNFESSRGEVTKSTLGIMTKKFLGSYIDTHWLQKLIKTNRLTRLKIKALTDFFNENVKEQKPCPMGDHKGSGLAERKMQALNGRVEIIILDKNKKHKNKTSQYNH